MVATARSKMIDVHIAALKAAQGKKVEAGWFESARYPAKEGESVGRPIAQVARLLEFGGTIQHPGGTKYIDDAIVGGNAVGARFVKGSFSGSTKVTGPHNIDIPARPFMRLAWKNFSVNASKLQAKIASGIVNRKITAEQGLAQIGMELENQIVKSIRDGGWAPNAPSTVVKKGFDKPLIESSLMWKSVTSKVS
jgi:phage gpG-like protein